MNTCIDCNWFSTREEYCSKHHKKVKSDNVACGDLWLIVRPIPDDELGLDKDREARDACDELIREGKVEEVWHDGEDEPRYRWIQKNGDEGKTQDADK